MPYEEKDTCHMRRRIHAQKQHTYLQLPMMDGKKEGGAARVIRRITLHLQLVKD
jgi:hypothetical protein